jgi:hypothetical protein
MHHSRSFWVPASQADEPKDTQQPDNCVSSCRLVGKPYLGILPTCPSSAQNPKPAGPGRERYRCLRQKRIIKARDSAMLAT